MYCSLSHSLSLLLLAAAATTAAAAAAGLLVVDEEVGVVNHQALINFGGKGLELPPLFVCFLFERVTILIRKRVRVQVEQAEAFFATTWASSDRFFHTQKKGSQTKRKKGEREWQCKQHSPCLGPPSYRRASSSSALACTGGPHTRPVGSGACGGGSSPRTRPWSKENDCVKK